MKDEKAIDTLLFCLFDNTASLYFSFVSIFHKK